MLEYLIVCPLVFLGGFVDAVAGGGGLISLPAYMLAGLSPIEAIGTNKFSACSGTAVATWRYSRFGFIHWRHLIAAIAADDIGAVSAIPITTAITIPIKNGAYSVATPTI